jgi:hypothetical protein
MEQSGELINRLIAATMAAETAEVVLGSEPAHGNAVPGLDRSLRGIVNFSSGRARLVTEPGVSPEGEETLVIGGSIYRRLGDEAWRLVHDELERDNIAYEGFGLLSFARGVQDVLEVQDLPDGHSRLRLRLGRTVFFDDLSVTDVLQVPTAVLGEPLIATLEVDEHERICSFAMESEKRSRMKVAQRRFRLELSNFGVPVTIEPPDPALVVIPTKRRLWDRGQLLRKLKFPATS